MYPVSDWLIVSAFISVIGVAAIVSIPVVVAVLLCRRLLARRLWMLPLGYWRAAHLTVWSVVVTLPVAATSNSAEELIYEGLFNAILLRVWGLSLAMLTFLFLIPWWHITAFTDPEERQ